MKKQRLASGFILGIGMHKTGSTSIQKAFSGYDDGHTLYPKLGPIPNHSYALLAKYGGKCLPQVLNGPAYARDATDAEFDDMFRLAQQRRRVILVAEAIGVMASESKSCLLSDLTRISQDVHVHMYAREPVSYAGSAISQRISHGQTGPTRKALNVKIGSRARFWVQELGLDHVSVNDFHQSILDHGDIVTDFARLLGVDKSRLSNPDHRALVSPSFTAIRLLAKANKAGARHDNRARYKIKTVLGKAYAHEPKINKTDLTGCINCPIAEVEELSQWGIQYEAASADQNEINRLYGMFEDVSDISTSPLLEEMDRLGIPIPKRRDMPSLLEVLLSFFRYATREAPVN